MGRETRRSVQPAWLARLRGSLKGIAFGVLLAFLASCLLFWNEGRAVRRYEALLEGQGEVTSIDPSRVDPSNEGRLVHLSGEATTEEWLVDDQFGVRVRALYLRRSVEMYQWAESQSRRSEELEGNQTETVTTYSYEPRWSAELIDSARFREPEGHENPPGFPITSRSAAARDVRIGAFRLSEGLIRRIDQFVPLDLKDTSRLATDLRWRARLLDGGVFLGRSPTTPAVGDVKIRFEQVPFTVVSVIARQIGETFEPFYTSSGETIELLRRGAVSHDAMFQSAHRGNRINTWILRFLGILIMYLGVGKVLRPVAVASGAVPVVGDAVASGTRLISMLLAGAVSLVVISAGWIYARPLLALGILVAAGVAAMLFLILLRRATSNTTRQ